MVHVGGWLLSANFLICSLSLGYHSEGLSCLSRDRTEVESQESPAPKPHAGWSSRPWHQPPGATVSKTAHHESLEITSLCHISPLDHCKCFAQISDILNPYFPRPSPSAVVHRGFSSLTELQALALSTLESLLRSVLKTFIFSTRHVRAVSVASPTFS